MHHFEYQRERALDKLQRLVHLRAVKGGLTVSDRHVLRIEAERLALIRDDANQLMAAFAPWPEPPHVQETVPDPATLVEPWAWAELEHQLTELGLHDLYEALGVLPDAEMETLTARLNEPASNRSSQFEPDWLTDELRKQAHQHLGTPDARARYDRSLEQAHASELAHILAITLRGQLRLDPDTRHALLTEAAALGLNPDQAETLLRRVCKEQGVAIELRPDQVPGQTHPAFLTRWLRCGRCRGLTALEAAPLNHGSGTVCQFCQAALRWECPRCQRGHWLDERRCDCNFSRDNVQPLIEHFEAAQQAFRLRRFREALLHLRQVQKYAPTHVGARKGLEKIQQQIGEIRRVRAAYTQEVAAGRLVAAMAEIEHWSRLASPTDSRLKAARAQAATQLAEARSQARQADLLASTEPATARQLYRDALTLAADLPEAISGLQHCPPDGPTELTADLGPACIALRWHPPTPDGLGPCRYQVLRNSQRQPAHAEDGDLVAQVPETSWTDSSVSPGVAYGYAVFAVRRGVRSVLGVATGPFLSIDEVRQVVIEPDRAQIRLRWSAPPEAAAVRVVRRQEGPVRNIRDGVILKSTREAALDTDLNDGQIYQYGIYALFKGQDGKLHPSHGVHLQAVPGRPPEPVTDLRVVDDGTESQAPLTLGYTPVARGKLRVARLAKRPDWHPGERKRAADFEAMSATWLDEVAPGRVIDAHPNPPRPCFYLPLVFHQGLATVGTPLAYVYLPDPGYLHAHRDRTEPDVVLLTWRWPSEPTHARCLVLARTGRPASGPWENDCRSILVDRTTYDRAGAFRLTLPPRADLPWYVSVFSQCELGGETWTSAGRNPSAQCAVPQPGQEALVYYAVKPGGVARPWTLTVRTEPAGATVGPLLLVAQPRILPLTPQDGLVIARFPQAHDGDTLKLDPATRLQGRKLRLFADPEARTAGAHARIRLIVPE